MIILDTNVISEPLRLQAEPRVIAWLDAQEPSELWLTAITATELQTGIERMPEGAKRRNLEVQIRAILDEDFSGRIAAIDVDAAPYYAEIAAAKARLGQKVEVLDVQIAAIARLRGAVVATRNIKNFDNCGIELVDPWTV